MTAFRVCIIIPTLCALLVDASCCFPWAKCFSRLVTKSESTDSEHMLELMANLEDPLLLEDRYETHQESCEQLRMDMYAASAPNPKKAKYGGDDAYYTSHDKQMFTINDGVSGSRRPACFPNVVSRILALKTIQSFSRTNDWKAAMDASIRRLQMYGICGTTTTVVVRKPLLTHRNVVSVYNLGDCRVIHLRRNKSTNLYEIVGITEGQKLSFPRNCPYQITGDTRVYQGFGVEQMEEYIFDVEEDDLIVGASDGLWDVIDMETVTRLTSQISVESLAKSLTEMASQARESGNWPDDITVVVGRMAAPDSIRDSFDQNNCNAVKETLEMFFQVRTKSKSQKRFK